MTREDTRRGFAGWPRDAWWWAAALAERPGVYWTKLHRGKGTYLTAVVAPRDEVRSWFTWTLSAPELEQLHDSGQLVAVDGWVGVPDG